MSFLPTFRPLSRGPVAWQVGTYQPDQWYAVMWDNLSGPWRVHTALGPFQAAREVQQAARQLAAEQVAALGRPSDSQPL